MSNNAAGLNVFLATALRDTAYAVWVTGEMDNLITWAVASLAPRYTRPLDPRAVACTVSIVSGTYIYGLDSTIRYVSRVDLVDSGGTELGPIPGNAWEIIDHVLDGRGELRVSPTLNDSFASGHYYINGYGVYDTSTNLIPDRLVPLVIAKARAEAYRRMAGNRAQFETWLARDQGQNVSVNELLELINEADAEIKRLEGSTERVWQKPVPGRQG